MYRNLGFLVYIIAKLFEVGVAYSISGNEFSYCNWLECI